MVWIGLFRYINKEVNRLDSLSCSAQYHKIGSCPDILHGSAQYYKIGSRFDSLSCSARDCGVGSCPDILYSQHSARADITAISCTCSLRYSALIPRRGQAGGRNVYRPERSLTAVSTVSSCQGLLNCSRNHPLLSFSIRDGMHILFSFPIKRRLMKVLAQLLSRSAFPLSTITIDIIKFYQHIKE